MDTASVKQLVGESASAAAAGAVFLEVSMVPSERYRVRGVIHVFVGLDREVAPIVLGGVRASELMANVGVVRAALEVNGLRVLEKESDWLDHLCANTPLGQSYAAATEAHFH